MTRDVTSQVPIGLFLKRADAAITAYASKALQEVGIDRTQWQMLRIVHEARVISKESVRQSLKDFIDEQTFNKLLQRLTGDGWIAEKQGQLALTDAGNEKHDQAFEIQKQVRQQTVKGISEEEYNAVIRVLQQVIENLK
ncbi:MAG: MarR family winged helix-turn-helix transcriptional regulator [Candidatus Saccharimonadales bacterium]